MPPEGSTRAGRREARRGAVAGLAGGAAALVAAAVTHTLAPSVPFPPLAIAQTLVRATPGGLATGLIEVLGHWALRIAVIGTLLGFLLSGSAAGLAIPLLERRLPWPRPAAAAAGGFLPLWAAIVLLSPSDPQFVGKGLLAVAMVPVVAAAAITAGITYGRLGSPAPPIEDGRKGAAAPASGVSRRVVLRSLWWGAAASLLGVSNLGRILRPRPNPGRLPLRLTDATPPPPAPESPADRAFDHIPGLTPEITPNEDFYVVDEEIIDPDIDPQTWSLTVAGLVGRPVRFTYDELLKLPATERYQTLECISNKVGGDLISNAKWVGIPLPLILERAGVDKGAVEVVFRAVGGYSDSLPIGQAMDESTLIAVGMNEHVLPREHGFPARLLSVGTYGMKNPKWLTRIDVVDRPYEGYWELRGWSKRAAVKTGSRIDVPSLGQSVSGRVSVAGIAFAGNRGISRVEVSTDGGVTWRPAELKRPLSPLTWRQWRLRWTPPPGSGRSQIVARAVDGGGAVQQAAPTPPHPNGASGYDGRTIIRATGSS